MKVACLGGGPAGLYFAISMKLRDPQHEVTVIERNKFDDTFGWGVVLSDETLENFKANDEKSAEAIRAHFAYWMILRFTTETPVISQVVTASAASAASNCCSSFRTVPVSLVSIWSLSATTPAPKNS